ncbi:MAG: DUF1684 domain-containing protein [Saprospiraceae bacterium]
MKLLFTALLLFYASFTFAFQTVQKIDKQYIAEIEAWRAQRIASLKSEDGWLNLAGLLPLKEGKNTFGSDKSNAIIFPKGDAFLGNLILENGEVKVEISPKTTVYQGDNKVKNLKIFSLKEKPIILQHQSLRWFIIKRGERYFVRLRDLESPNVTHFPGIESFPIDPTWRIEATLEPAAPDFKIPVVDIIGTSSMQPSPGAFRFEIQGKTYSLYPTSEGDQLFFVFGDATNGDTTYGAGRFLYAKQPDANGKIILDFNKAYNPPCAFTAFATCPLPSEMNKLSIEINAGEKNFGEH